jgi:thymidylate synthase (FAD)
MKIIDQSYEIIQHPENVLEIIEKCGRTCYKSEDKIGCTTNGILTLDDINCCTTNGILTLDDINLPCQYFINQTCNNNLCINHSSHKFVQKLRDRGHHAMIEFGDIIVKLITNRGVTHELVRHRLCSFAQESTRYVNYKGRMEFIKPVWWNDSTDRQKELWAEGVRCTEVVYRNLIKEGWRPEQAREVLPNSLKTEIVTKANIREWRHIFNLRCNKKSHPQIRTLFLSLLKELKEKIPIVFDDIKN